VTIIGTNLLKSSGTTTTAPLGGEVRFAPYTATATHTGTRESPRQLSVVVPSDATDGPIRVSTFNDVLGERAVLSGTQFVVPPPGVEVDCFPHTRSIALSLRRHLVARGMVSADDGFTACAATVPVKIQRRVSGNWKTVASATTTSTGAYKKRIPDKTGRYRARATIAPLTRAPTSVRPPHHPFGGTPRLDSDRLDRRTGPFWGRFVLCPGWEPIPSPYPVRILILPPVPGDARQPSCPTLVIPVQSFGRHLARAPQAEPSGSRLRNLRRKP
jgi:hypothetical protein